MNDNEKRAHDFAIAMIPIAFENHKASIISKELCRDSGFDAYQAYMDVYKKSLELFNRDFRE